MPWRQNAPHVAAQCRCAAGAVLRVAFRVLHIACCVLRVTHCVLRAACRAGLGDKMLYTWLLIAAVAVGAVYGDDTDDCCSVEDKKEVAFMWHKVWHSSYTDRKVRIMKAVVDQ